MDIRRNASEIKRLLKERKDSLLALSRFLMTKGFSSSLADEIVHEVLFESGISGLTEVVASRIRVLGELPLEGPKKLAFIGPTGVGKTTIVMKLADHYLKQGRKVALMSLEMTKQSALKEWALRKEIPFLESPKCCKYDILLIDTEGCNYYLPNRVNALGEMLAEFDDDIEIILTLSAAAKEVDLYGAVHQFSPICPSSLSFTKLDETLASGVLINVCAKSDYAIRYVAYGYPLPGYVQIAETKLLASKMLTDFNNSEFNQLRQLTISNLN